MSDRDDNGGWRERLHLPAVATVIALVIAAGIILLRENGGLFFFEAKVADLLIRAGAHSDPKQNPVVIVQITERDIRAWQQYPISDRKLAELLEVLVRAGPRAIGVDIYRDVITPDIGGGASPKEDRERLIKFVAANRQISLIYLNAKGEDRVNPPAEPEVQRNLVLSLVTVDKDGIGRRAPLFGFDEVTGRNEPTLMLGVALRYLRAEKIVMKPLESDPNSLSIGQAVITPFESTYGPYGRWLEEEEAKGQQLALDYLGPAEFERYDVEQVLNDPSLAARFKDRIVLIGAINKSVKDIVPSPLSAQMPGVEFHAHAAEQLIRAARTGVVSRRVLPDATENLYIVIAALAGAAVSVVIRSQLRMLPILLLLLAAIALGGWWAIKRYSLVPIIPPMLAMALSGALTTAYVAFNQRRQRQTLMSLFGKTVSPAVAGELWRQRRQLLSAGRMKPREMIATVLFFDLKGFTELSEKSDATAMIALLNELFEEMATTVEAHGGVVNKFVGDQILALFGPPLPRTTAEHHRADANAAVRCAIALRQKLVKINQDWSRLGRPVIFMRVGIYTGTLVAGSVGSRERLEYTVIGDTVNTASRLESVEKEKFDETIAPGGCRILIGQPTLDQLDGAFRVQKFDVGELKGKRQSVAVYAVLGYADSELGGVE